MLLLPGAPGRADTAFEYILALEPTYRVLAPDYPDRPDTLEALLSGLIDIIRAEGISSVSLTGGSYSGLIAQAMVRRYPDYINNLVLSDTGVPDIARGRRYSRYLLLLEALPLPAIRALWRVGAARYLNGISADRAFWQAYFRELISTISKQECVGRLKIWIDFDRNCRFTAHDLDGWPGRLLILAARDDTTFPAWERDALRALYPRARYHIFPGGGHAASITERSAYISAIRSFLAEAGRAEAAS